jgi:hypothetical protein
MVRHSEAPVLARGFLSKCWPLLELSILLQQLPVLIFLLIKDKARVVLKEAGRAEDNGPLLPASMMASHVTVTQHVVPDAFALTTKHAR